MLDRIRVDLIPELVGDLRVRDLEAIARGLEEVVEEPYLRYRIRSIEYLAEKSKDFKGAAEAIASIFSSKRTPKLGSCQAMRGCLNLVSRNCRSSFMPWKFSGW